MTIDVCTGQQCHSLQSPFTVPCVVSHWRSAARVKSHSLPVFQNSTLLCQHLNVHRPKGALAGARSPPRAAVPTGVTPGVTPRAAPAARVTGAAPLGLAAPIVGSSNWCGASATRSAVRLAAPGWRAATSAARAACASASAASSRERSPCFRRRGRACTVRASERIATDGLAGIVRVVGGGEVGGRARLGVLEHLRARLGLGAPPLRLGLRLLPPVRLVVVLLLQQGGRVLRQGALLALHLPRAQCHGQGAVRGSRGCRASGLATASVWPTGTVLRSGRGLRTFRAPPRAGSRLGSGLG